MFSFFSTFSATFANLLGDTERQCQQLCLLALKWLVTSVAINVCVYIEINMDINEYTNTCRDV